MDIYTLLAIPTYPLVKIGDFLNRMARRRIEDECFRADYDRHSLRTQDDWDDAIESIQWNLDQLELKDRKITKKTKEIRKGFQDVADSILKTKNGIPVEDIHARPPWKSKTPLVDAYEKRWGPGNWGPEKEWCPDEEDQYPQPGDKVRQAPSEKNCDICSDPHGKIAEGGFMLCDCCSHVR